MFPHRSEQHELLDDFSLSSEALRRNLDEMELTNNWLGSKQLLLHALQEIQSKYSDYFNKNKIVIGDLGCGNGDLLRSIDTWRKAKNLTFDLVGIDANHFTIQYAKLKSRSHCIQFITEDILLPLFSKYQFDIVCLNSICHHFTDEILIQLIQDLQKQTRIAIVINDLQRHPISYYSIKCLSLLFGFSYLAKKDAPLSVMRAFRKKELIHLLASANISNYQLHWAWAFRWKLIIWCKKI